MANKGEWVVRYEEQVMFSQLIPSMNCRAFFAGVADANKPGSIHLLKYPFEKISEIQAHSTEVQRLSVTPDNKTVFSAGNDGSLCCFKFDDKELE